ncbi:hypothetical protein NC653_003431 [Populus alba x Populus x berolinensis]|uniref:Uncharacterized protein n=1 Tax=Populus alba x Populus x berolinensis TaxID=444605 RepID=A0AAD6RRH6_9ROSI|nr:hypothetical protein NC653_003431 [Populus alba x Populus x berolinensis]
MMLWRSDWKAWADVIKLLKRLEKKMTILVVSHDPNYQTCSQSPASVLKVLGALRHKGFLEPRCKAQALV